MASAASIPVRRIGIGRLRLLPSLPDLFFAILLGAVFGRPYAWQGLLGDGDTGWHIRTGEFVWEHGTAPLRDLFSYSREGQPWYAWEWLSDVILARIHGWWGLPGVAIWAAIMIALAPTLLFVWMLRREVGAGVALAVSLAAASAASIHYLARPHLFSLVLWVAGLIVLEKDRRSPTPWLWMLVPMAGVWANLHAGFAAWLGILAVLAGGTVLRRQPAHSVRYLLLLVLSTLATLVNPYGWRLHCHILEFLNSDWIVRHVQEFQSPDFRSESMTVFALLLVAGVASAARGWRRSRWFEASLVALLGFAALRSARYVPLFAMAAAPAIATQIATWWRSRAEMADAGSPVRILWEASQSLGTHRGFTPWLPLLAIAAVSATLPASALGDFPEKWFPVEAVNRSAALLTSPGQRVLTSDQWADYLIYRLHPRVRVFFDGRSDFYGAAVGDDYRTLLSAGAGSTAVLGRWGFTAALLPADWPLRQILELNPAWRVEYRDARAVLFVKNPGKTP